MATDVAIIADGTHIIVALAATFIEAQCVHVAESTGRIRVYDTFLATFNQVYLC